MQRFAIDWKASVRTWRRSPGLAVVAVLALALGIGATTTMFSIVHGATRDLPFDEPHELMLVTQSRPREGITDMGARTFDVIEWRGGLRSFAGLAAFGSEAVNVSDDAARPERVAGAAITPNAFLLLGEPPQIFVPFSQAPETQVSLVVRTSIPAETLLPSVRREVWAVDPSLPVEHWTMEELFGDALASSRFQARLLSGFALAALLIAVLGIYAVVSHTVMLRTREVGVRMALGAESRHVVRMVVGQGALLTGTGCALGLLGALALSGVLRESLFEVRPADPWTLSGAAVLLAVVATVATWLPARRAANVDPTVALRAE